MGVKQERRVRGAAWRSYKSQLNADGVLGIFDGGA